jgi:hypothetical protein
LAFLLGDQAVGHLLSSDRNNRNTGDSYRDQGRPALDAIHSNLHTKTEPLKIKILSTFSKRKSHLQRTLSKTMETMVVVELGVSVTGVTLVVARRTLLVLALLTIVPPFSVILTPAVSPVVRSRRVRGAPFPQVVELYEFRLQKFQSKLISHPTKLERITRVLVNIFHTNEV